jgi:hypothetical protein
LSTHLLLGLRSGLCPSGFPTNILYAFLVSPIRVICPVHLILLDQCKHIQLFINDHCMFRPFNWSPSDDTIMKISEEKVRKSTLISLTVVAIPRPQRGSKLLNALCGYMWWPSVINVTAQFN